MNWRDHYVRLACTEASVLAKFAKMSCALAKFAKNPMKTAWVHTGALKALVCTQAVFMMIFVDTVDGRVLATLC